MKPSRKPVINIFIQYSTATCYKFILHGQCEKETKHYKYIINGEGEIVKFLETM